MNLDTLPVLNSGPPHLLESLSVEQRSVRVRPTVLLAEDDDDLRPIMQCTLEVWGYQVVACADAQTAAAAFRRIPDIDVLLTDFDMPGRTGVELARELTLCNVLLPVLLYTGSQLSTELRQEIHDRHWAYVRKPGVMSELQGMLAQMVGTRVPKGA